MRAALFVLLAGCSVSHPYLVDAADLAQLHDGGILCGNRQKDGTRACVRGDTVVRESAKPQPDGKVRVISKTHSDTTTMGSALTWLGTPISVAGTLLIILGSGTTKGLGYAMALSAEPVMITGTVLWCLGLVKHPQEVAP
jgi:hypothetical protein